MHDALVNVFGGTSGIRDEGALASALMRPQLGYYESLIQEAAALMESLANNHAFVDGNNGSLFLSLTPFCGGNPDADLVPSSTANPRLATAFPPPWDNKGFVLPILCSCSFRNPAHPSPLTPPP